MFSKKKFIGSIRNQKLSISSKFNILTIFLIVATSIAVASFLTYSEINEHKESLVHHGSSFGKLLAENSEFAIYTEDRLSLEQIANSIEADDHIAYVFIVNKDNKVIAQNSKNPSLQTPPSEVPRHIYTHNYKIRHTKFTSKLDGKAYIDFLVPVVSLAKSDIMGLFADDPEGLQTETIGYVQLGYSLEGLQKYIKEYILSTLLFTTIFIIVGITLTLFMTKKIVNPIRMLVSVTHDVAEGKLDHQITINTRDEIADLAHSFNEMIDRLRKYKSEVKEHQRTLEDKVEQRTRELKIATDRSYQMAQHAEAANLAKSTFLANMSHELRTPLNAIIGFSEILVDKHFGPLNESQNEYINDILNSGKHLLALVQDILDLSKIETGNMELDFSELSIEDLVNSSIVMVREKAMKHGIRLSVDASRASELIVADERKVKQVLYNLLSNAVKFTPDGGSITVTGENVDSQRIRDHIPERFREKIFSVLDEAHALYVKLTVADTGKGIKEEFHEKIFKPFQQEDASTSRQYGGTGLGLTLSKRIVALHKGGIWVESTVRKGSSFSFVLPITVDLTEVSPDQDIQQIDTDEKKIHD